MVDFSLILLFCSLLYWHDWLDNSGQPLKCANIISSNTSSWKPARSGRQRLVSNMRENICFILDLLLLRNCFERLNGHSSLHVSVDFNNNNKGSLNVKFSVKHLGLEKGPSWLFVVDCQRIKAVLSYSCMTFISVWFVLCINFCFPLLLY